MSKQMKVTIKKSGEVEVEAVGYQGEACELATREFELALGSPGAREMKPERFEQEAEMEQGQ